MLVNSCQTVATYQNLELRYQDLKLPSTVGHCVFPTVELAFSIFETLELVVCVFQTLELVVCVFRAVELAVRILQTVELESMYLILRS